MATWHGGKPSSLLRSYHAPPLAASSSCLRNSYDMSGSVRSVAAYLIVSYLHCLGILPRLVSRSDIVRCRPAFCCLLAVVVSFS